MSRFKPPVAAPGVVPGNGAPSPAVAQNLRNPRWRDPVHAPARAVAEPDSALRRIGLYSAVGYLFVRFTFLHEILALTLGLHSYLPPLFGIPALIGVILGGGLQRALRQKTTLLWLMFAVWLIVTVPFSYPYHRDPIDTMYRPSPSELSQLFAGARMLDGTILGAGTVSNSDRSVGSGARIVIK